MCGIGGQLALARAPIAGLSRTLTVMSQLLAHRGPDGHGQWISEDHRLGLFHRRLAVIDLSASGAQPMSSKSRTVITFNGEVYNFPELRSTLETVWDFRTNSDTECVLAAYDRYGDVCPKYLRGMFAFAIWDEKRSRLFCARDRFGIKPFYYTVQDGIFYFGSEAKSLLPFLPDVNTDEGALAEYLTFQYTIGEKTLFRGIFQLLPGHSISIEDGQIKIARYWDVSHEIDYDHSPSYFNNRLRELLEDSISVHGRSDVPVGSYVSGGIDSSLIYRLAKKNSSSSSMAFHGRFSESPSYDESEYASIVTNGVGDQLHCLDITADDFRDNLTQVIYHLDTPVAGPGAFPQFMVSGLAAKHVKVVLGGQGGDEIFGGYARYLVAYFEQCLKAAIDGQYKNGNYVVTLESIIPNLGLLREYKPLLQEFWRDGLFGPMDERYFRLINRSTDMVDEVNWAELNTRSVYEDFSTIFNNPKNVKKEAYFDKMTHFDLKCLLPALLQVEDRMSMAHGLESRVPMLDHPLVEFVASIPADIKFRGGDMKHLLKEVFSKELPPQILNRRDKMGFPVPLKEWSKGPLKEFMKDTFSTTAIKQRQYLNSKAILKNFNNDIPFSRKNWGLLSLEIWQQHFHDRAAEWKAKKFQS